VEEKIVCGINGFTWDDSKLIKKMNMSIAHRGPDDDGTYTDTTVSLGNRRLAIIDLSPSAKQPMSNEDHTIWITYNGEIYNFQELRTILEKKGHSFATTSDTEVIIHGYEEYGMEILNELNGMFAFALYDSTKSLLFLARDRFGIKPLYYSIVNGNIIFSSEIKGILVHDIKRDCNEEMIFEYLIHGLIDHKEETFFKSIYRVMPGTYLEFECKTHKIRKKKWYFLHDNTVVDPQKIRESFEKSVRYRLISDVPVGSCLSGGIDSSSIVCSMNTISSNPQIKTFSAIFPGSSIDESQFIEEVIHETGAESYTTVPQLDTLLKDLPNLIHTQEEPFLGTSMYAQYCVMNLAHENGMKVLLDGQGADELFAGYPIYLTPFFIELAKTLKWATLIREGLSYMKTQKNVYLFAHMISSCLRSLIETHDIMPSWIAPGFFYRYSTPRKYIHDLNRKLVETLTHSTIPGLLRYEDKNAMRWSVETRLPFLDHEFVEHVLKIPAELKIRKGITKYIFREAMKGILPEVIRRRTDKIGFATPEEEWLANSEFLEFASTVIDSDSFQKREYWNVEKVKKTFHSFRGGNMRLKRTVWKWINLELWLRMFIDMSYK
jgi:asparagine synthase (glutamine-hydrolysing)